MKRPARPGKKRGNENLKRIFFAIDLPEATIAAAERLVDEFDVPPGRIRWVRPGNLHLTLKFLGEIEESRIRKIGEAAREALSAFGPVELTIEGVGIFPNHDSPRVVWLGVGGDTETLSAMEKELSKRLEPLGFPPDQRPFTAHLTIGRVVKSDLVRGQLARLLRQYQREFVGRAPVEEIRLYESKLDPAGSIYTVVETFPLRGGT